MTTHGSLHEATTAAFADAWAGGITATVLLAPAAASFDQFDSFADRGDTFVSIAQQLAASVAEQAREALVLDRTDRSLVGIWWWTVDKWLLAGAMLLMVLGSLLIMAAGPAVANLINLPSQHFMARQLLYILPSLAVMIIVSMLEPKPIRALSLVGLACVIGLMIMAIVAGSEIKGATRWITLYGFNLQPSEFAKPLFAIVSAWLRPCGVRGRTFLAGSIRPRFWLVL